MKLKRDTSGIKQAAQRKRLQTLTRAESGIQQLIRLGEPVTFASVAEIANVSTSWLYRQPQLVERITAMRAQQPKAKVTPTSNQITVSFPAQDKMIQSLKSQVKALKAEVQALTQQIEAFEEMDITPAKGSAGELQLLLDQALQDLEREKQKNLRQKAQVTDLKYQLPPASNQVMSTPSGSFSPAISKGLEEIQIKPNKGVRDAMAQLTQEQVLAAIAAFKEQAKNPGKVIKSKVAYFVSLLTRQAQPNDEGAQDQNIFNEWFEIARALGLVTASTMNRLGELVCLDEQGEPHSFQDYWLKEYPLSELERRADELINL